MNNWLEINENIICWWNIKSCSIKRWVNICVVVCLVLTSIIKELSARLCYNVDISIETIRFDEKHYPAVVCLLNKSLVGSYYIFTIPLIGWIGNITLPDCVFLNKKVPLIVNYLLVWGSGTSVCVSWANPKVQNRILELLRCCTIGIIYLLLTLAGLLRKWHRRIAAGRLSIICIAQALFTPTL